MSVVLDTQNSIPLIVASLPDTGTSGNKPVKLKIELENWSSLSREQLLTELAANVVKPVVARHIAIFKKDRLAELQQRGEISALVAVDMLKSGELKTKTEIYSFVRRALWRQYPPDILLDLKPAQLKPYELKKLYQEGKETLLLSLNRNLYLKSGILSGVFIRWYLQGQKITEIAPALHISKRDVKLCIHELKEHGKTHAGATAKVLEFKKSKGHSWSSKKKLRPHSSYMPGGDEELQNYFDAMPKCGLLTAAQEVAIGRQIRKASTKLQQICLSYPKGKMLWLNLVTKSLKVEDKAGIRRHFILSGIDPAGVRRDLSRLSHEGLDKLFRGKNFLKAVNRYRLKNKSLYEIFYECKEVMKKHDLKQAQDALVKIKACHNKLVRHNLGSIIIIASNYKGLGLDMADLLQEGNMGLLHSAEVWNPDLGYRFLTRATFGIRAAIKRAVSEQGALINLPEGLVDDYLLIKKNLKPGETVESVEALPGAMSSRVGLSVDRIHAVLQAIRQKPVSINQPRRGKKNDSEAEYTLDEGLFADLENVDCDVIDDETRDRLALQIAQLPVKYREIIIKNYGLPLIYTNEGPKIDRTHEGYGNPISNDEIGKLLKKKVTHQAIQQKNAKARKILKGIVDG